MIAPPLWPFDSETDPCGKVSAESPEPCQSLAPSSSSPFRCPSMSKLRKLVGFDLIMASPLLRPATFSSHCFHHA